MDPDPKQPGRSINGKKLKGLAESIKEFGEL